MTVIRFACAPLTWWHTCRTLEKALPKGVSANQ